MRRYLSDASFSAISHALAAIASIGLQVTAIRIATLREYGEYAAALAVVLVVEALFITRSAELALQTVAKYWIAGEFPQARYSAVRNTRLDFAVNCAVYTGLIGFAWLIAPRFGLSPWYISVLGLGMLVQTGYAVSKAIFVASSRIREQAYFEWATYVVMISAGVAGVWFFGIPGLIAATVFTTFAKTLISHLITRRWWPKGIRYAMDDASVAAISRVSWSSSANSIARNAFASGTQQGDVLVLSAIAGAESTAIYKAAKMAANAPMLLLNPLWVAVRPRLMRAVSDANAAQVRRLIVLPASAMLALLAICIVPLWFLADQFVVVLFGAEYRAAAVPFVLLFLGNWVFGGLTSWYTMWIILQERRFAGTLTYAFLFFAILAGVWIYGAASPTHVATVVMVSLISTAIVCWIQFYISLRRMAGRIEGEPVEPSPVGHRGKGSTV